VQQLAAQIPWFHNCILRERAQGPADREWYIRQTIQNGWSRNILALQIESRLHERQGKAITNFPATATASIGEATAHVRSPQSGRRIDLVARSVAALIGLCRPVVVSHGGVRRTLTSPRKPERITAVVGNARIRIC